MIGKIDRTFTDEEERALGIPPEQAGGEEEWVDTADILPRVMRDLELMACLYQMHNFHQRQKELIASARASIKEAIRLEAQAAKQQGGDSQ